MIVGGRAHVRRILYMATVTAIKHNPVIRTFFHRLVTAGRPGKSPLAALTPSGCPTAQGTPRSPETARPDGLPLGRAGLRDGSRRGRPAGYARHLSPVRGRAECEGGGAVGPPDGLPVSDPSDLSGRRLRGGVESSRRLAAARNADEPRLCGRVRVRPPAREAGACGRPDPPCAARHARSGSVAGEARGRAIRAPSRGRDTCRTKRSCGRTRRGGGTRAQARPAKDRPC